MSFDVICKVNKRKAIGEASLSSHFGSKLLLHTSLLFFLSG